MSVKIQRRLFTADEYQQMIQAGMFHEDDRLELIEGEIVEMSPIGSEHAACVNRLTALFSRRLGGRAVVSVQNPLQVSERSQPQPDLALLRPRADYYAQAHPKPADVLLVVEVAETSADYDRHVKLPLYSRAGIAEAWLIGLESKRIEVYRQPSAAGYRAIDEFTAGQQIAPQAFPELLVPVDQLLG